MANDEGKGSGGKGGDPKELAKAMSEAKAASEGVTRSFQQQLNIITQLRDVMTQVTKNMNALCELDCAGMSPEKWGEITKAVEKTGGATNNTTESVKKMSDVMQSKWTKAALVGAAALDGLAQGLKNVAALTKAATGVFSNMIGGLGSIAASIIAIPFKLITGLFNMAQKGGGGNELAAAYEEVRKEFGSFKSESAKAIIDTAVNMDKMNQTGISSYRVFGNAAERLKAVKEMAVGMGAAFQVFAPEVEKNGTAIMMYNKGLGITNEQMSGLASNAMRMGKGIADVQLDMTKQALGMSKAFGVNAKVISKDMGKAMQDLAHFGHLSTKELAVAATFANKLGVSVDKLTGIMDATATFDQAAEGMSKLNEQFHTNINATEIMSAQNPAEKVEILRKEFAKTGKDMSKLSYQERMLIKQTTGLGDEALNAAFSAKNAGVSLDKMSSQAGKNEKKTMTQAEAMHELADSIERLTPSGSGGRGGLLSHFFDGFLRGIQGTEEFRTLMLNINKILIKATMYGVELGKAFVKMFPGVKKVFDGLIALFSVDRFENLFTGINDAFKEFFSGGSKNVKGLLDNLSQTFLKFFKGGEGGATKVLEGFKEFGQILIGIFSKLGIMVVDGLVKILPKITAGIHKLFEFLKNPNAAGIKLEGSIPAWLEPLITLFEKIKKELIPAVKPLLKEIFIGLAPLLLTALKDMLFIAFAPAVLKSVVGLIGSFIMNTVGKGLLHAIGGMGDEALKKAGPLAEKMSEIFENIFGKVGNFAKSNVGKLLGKAAIVVAVATAAVDVSQSIKKYGAKLEKDGFDPATAKIAAGTTGIINTLTFGLIPENFQSVIATTLAKGVDAIFKGFDKAFGPGFSDAIKKQFTSFFDIFGGLGDLLLALWHGDSKGVNDAIMKIGKGLVDMFLSKIELAANLLLKIGPLILEYFYKALGWVSNKIGDILLSLKDLPLVGFIFEWIGGGFKALGKILNQAGEAFAVIGTFMKSVNITKVLCDWGNAVVDFAKLLWVKFTWLVDVLTLPFRLFFNFVKTMYQALWEEVLEPAINFLIKWGKKALDVLLWPYKTLWSFLKMQVATIIEDYVTPIVNFLSKAGSLIRDILITPFVLAWNGIKSILSFMWDTFTGLLENFRTWGHQVLDILTEPHTRAWDRIKAVLSFIWEGFKELPEKFLSWSVKLFNAFTKPYVETWDWIKKTFGFERFKELGSSMIEGLLAPFVTLKDLISKPFKAAVEGIKNLLKINSPSLVFTEIGDNIATGLDNSMQQIPKNAEKVFNSTIESANNIQSPIAATSSIDTQQLTKLSSVSNELKDLPDIIEKIKIANNESKNLSIALSDLPKSIGQIGVSLQEFSSIPLAEMQASIKIVETIANTIQQLDDSLANFPKINLQSRLTELSKSTGLGSSGIYTVKSKEVVVNIELNVSMDVDKVEQVIISRHNSIIRDRINYAIEKGGQGDQNSANAKVKSTGPQTGFPGRQFGT